MTINNKKSKQKFKKKPEPAVLIALDELKSMIPVFIACNAIVVIICGIYSILNENTIFDWQLLIGLLIGNIATIANFCSFGFNAAKIIRGRNPQKAKVRTTTMYFARYFGAFITFGLLITFNIANPITLVVPLFFPRIHYMLKAIFHKKI